MRRRRPTEANLAADLQPLAHAFVTALHIPTPSTCPADAITAALRHGHYRIGPLPLSHYLAKLPAAPSQGPSVLADTERTAAMLTTGSSLQPALPFAPPPLLAPQLSHFFPPFLTPPSLPARLLPPPLPPDAPLF